MPQKTSAITVSTPDQSTILAWSLGTFIRLGWNPKYASDKVILGYTPRSGFKWNDEITIEAAPNQLTITSKLIHNESFDLMGRNKKHIAEFLSAFEAVKSSASEAEIEQWKAQLVTVGQETIKAAEKEIRDAEEIEKVMNFSKSNLYITYGIIAINTIIFILMVAGGMNFFAPKPFDVLEWGGNYNILTFGGEWWRLFTSVFLHFGIIHLALNMYALYFIGSYLEPLLGKVRYIVAYICAGVVASLVSVLWHNDNSAVSAGASGAIFGMFGLFLSLLITNVVPKQVKNSILQSVLFFVGFNVFYGFKPNSGIDNSAHLGGLFSGIIIGFVYYLSFRKPTIQKTALITALIAVGTIAVTVAVLQSKKTEPVDFKTVEARFKSGEALNKLHPYIAQFETLQNEAIEASDKMETVSNEDYVSLLKNKTLPNWTRAQSLMEEAKSLSLSGMPETLRQDYWQYATYRIEQVNLFIKVFEEDMDTYNESLNTIGNKIDSVVQKINEAIK